MFAGHQLELELERPPGILVFAGLDGSTRRVGRRFGGQIRWSSAS